MKNDQIMQLEHKPTIVIYSYGSKTDATSVIRMLDPMLASNWNVIWASKGDDSDISFNLDVAYQADVIIIQRHFPSKYTEKILRLIMTLGIPVVYDLDDMFLDVPSHHPSYDSLRKHVPFIKWILKEADVITVSTVPLKKSLSKYTSRAIHVKPNIVNFNLFAALPRFHNDQFNFLISGTPTHQRDWIVVEEPIAEILKIYGKNVGIVFFGEIPKRFFDHPSVNFIDYQSNYKQYAAHLKELNVHAALIPLEDTKFNQCKSNIKWLEYSASGIPGAYSDITPYNSSISQGRNGLLVKNNQDSWFNAMKELMVDSEKTTHMIKNAQTEVFNQYSIENSLDEYTTAISNLFEQEHKSNRLSELPIFHYRLRDNIKNSLDKHIIWRFKQ